MKEPLIFPPPGHKDEASCFVFPFANLWWVRKYSVLDSSFPSWICWVMAIRPSAGLPSS